MTDTSTNPELSRLQKAAYALTEMRARLNAAENAQHEPIAIVGMSGRFPGADSCEALWQLLINGVDAVTEIPPERWSLSQFYDPNPNAVGKMNARTGGFIQDVDLFDSAFFDIPAREAVKIDPQQRLLLEVAWEALEHAGQAPDRLQGTQTGTYLGINQIDYGFGQFHAHEDMDVYTTTGNGFCFASGRISYALGLQGPNMAVDTACSSSLVAVHLACQALRARECDLALAGGVQLNLMPTFHLLLAKTQSFAASGQCNTFSAAADGLIMGEGCGMVVLKRLGDAVANKDRVLALIRGSGVNHGGAASGITVPNELAQEALVRQVLQRAQVEPADVDYVETHGTGTQLGDPIEVGALSSVFRARRKDEPLVLGSLKTNIGHLDAAAGIAGLIKAVLSLEREQIPPNLHFDEPNPNIDWVACPLKVPVEPHAWPRRERPRHAGVSSFGFSGTNAHVVLAEAPSTATDTKRDHCPQHIFALSAKTNKALHDLVEAHVDFLESAAPSELANICFTSVAGRSHFEHRVAVIATSLPELCERLVRWQDNGEHCSYHSTEGEPKAGKIAFVFGDEGNVRAQKLYGLHPLYRGAVDRCAESVKGIVDVDIAAFFVDGAAPTNKVQLHLMHFVSQYAQSEFWRSCNILPLAVAGCGIGEYVAACVAGILSLDDALNIVAARAVLVDENKEISASVAAEQIEAQALKAAAVAAAPRLSVLSGTTAQFLSAQEDVGLGYWRELFAQSSLSPYWLAALATKDCRHVLKIGLAPDDTGAENIRLHDLSGDGEIWQNVTTILAQLYVAGSDIAWDAFAGPYARCRQALPTYPFQRQSYWFEAQDQRATSAQSDRNIVATGEPMSDKASLAKTGQEESKKIGEVPAVGFMQGAPLSRIMTQQLQNASAAISQVVAQQLEYLRANGITTSTPDPAFDAEAEHRDRVSATSLRAAVDDRSAEDSTKRDRADCSDMHSMVAVEDTHHLLLMGADTIADLDDQTRCLVQQLREDPKRLASNTSMFRPNDAHSQRRMLVCQEANEAIEALESLDPKRVTTSAPRTNPRRFTFMFPGVGDHYAGMARGLYERESVFRNCVDACCARVAPFLDQDLLEMLYPAVKEQGEVTSGGIDLRRMLKRGIVSPDDEPLAQTQFNQPAIFIIEYALAQLWMSWGFVPQALIGYSVGEYVAACLAGVMSLDDALTLLVKRAQLISEMPAGSMLAVPLPEDAVRSLLLEHSTLSISIVSTPSQCVVGGSPEAIAALEEDLQKRKKICRQLPTTHAFHSQMLAELHEPITAAAQAIRLVEPQIPFMSNLTGNWITAAEATAPRYWAEHTYKTVRFAEGVGELLKTADQVLLEVGPGQNLSSFVLQHPTYKKAQGLVVLPTVRNAYDRQSDWAFLLNTLGKLWLSGVDVGGKAIFSDE